VVLLDWARGGPRPTPGVVTGLALGLAGLALLVGVGGSGGGTHVDVVGALVLVVASLSWAVGSLYSGRAPLPASKSLATGMEMLGGGALLLLAGLATGEAHRLSLDAVSARSLLAMLYLITFGSLVGFTAYIWLLGATAPAKAATYAYVNPVVAVLLGWAVAGEPVTARTLVAGAVIVTAVALITASKSSARAVPDQPRAASGTTSANPPGADAARVARTRTAPARPYRK
jgi:drug/metabolite transporter (DMT)-like permease